MSDIFNLSFPPSFFEDEVREGFFVPGMMKRLWAGNLKVLSVIASICKKHDIPWFVICGTLLGTVRHGGFVPWDDDLDVIMKRDDLQRFLEIAPGEIPEGFRLCDVQRDYHMENSIARLINWEELTGGVVREFYGCPYTCGVDLFALDGRYPDEAGEKARRARYYDVLVAIKHVTLGTTDLEICQELLRKIERENHCQIIQDELMYGRLCAVINQIYREVPLQEGTECEMFHGIEDHLVFRTEWFREMVWMPFEHISLPVPVGYSEVLRSNYGDFMRIGRSGSAHDYPVYANQEKQMKQLMGHNPFRYTYEPEHLHVSHGVSLRRNAEEILKVLHAAEGKIADCRASGDEASAQQLEAAAAALMEKLSVLTGQKDAAGVFDLQTLERVLNQRHVLFLVVRPDWWETFEPYYREECADAGTSVTVACVPWYEVEIDLKQGQKHDECDSFPAELHVIRAEEGNLFSQIRDAVYIQFPFDETNQAVRIDRVYTAETLRKTADHVIYVPCFNPVPPAAEDGQGQKTLRYLAEQPAVVYADEVRLPSEEMRELYIECMTDIAGEDTRTIWEEKFKAGGETDG